MGNVLKISEAASLGFHAMVMLANSQDKLLSVKDIAQTLGVSANHLSKVLQRLTKSGLVLSIKGYNGGFKLAKKPKDITFMEIFETIDGVFSPTNCLLSKDTCPRETCIMGDLLLNMNNQVSEFLSKTTLNKF